MGRRNPFKEAPFAACCVLAFAIPFPFVYATGAIWMLAACWLLSLRFRSTAVAFAGRPAYWIWCVFFGLWAASWYWTGNKAEAEFDTVSKLSFVLMPLLAGAGSGIDQRGLSDIVLSFIGGVCLAGLYCLNQANVCWQEDGQMKHFLYHELTRGLDANAVYMAWYVIVALAGLLVFPWKDAGKRWMVWWRWPAVLFCAAFLTLLASRLLIVVFLLLVIPVYGIRYFRRTKRSVLIPLAAIIVVISAVGILTRTHNPIHKRFSEVMHPDMCEVKQDSFYNLPTNFTNLTLRLFVWRIAIENLEVRHLWKKGAGNGDVHDIQNEQIRSHGVPGMTEESKEPKSELYNVNLHNMYLQTLLTLGIPGLALFMMIVFGPLYYLHRSNAGYFFGLFHIISMLFMVQESALQTQAGVVFYCFFSALFWQGVKRRSKSEKEVLVKGN